MKTKLLFATLLLLAISWQQTNAQTVLPEMTKAITGDRIENVYNGTDSISSSIKFKKRNSFLILMNMEYEVLITQGGCAPQLADTTNIKKQVKEFLLNADRKEEDAEYIKMELPILGEREVISRDHCIMVMVHESMIDSASNSIDYLSKDHPHIIEQLYGAYNEIRDEFAIKEFNKPFDQCNEEQKNVCRIAYPCMILSHERSHERYVTVPPPPGAEYKLITTDSISGYVINEEREDSITYRICHETATLELGGNGCIDFYTIIKLQENINVEYVKNLIIGPDVSEYNYSFFLSLVSITVDKENKVYDSRENCNAIIETKTNTMIMGCESTFIPNGVEIIKENCMRNLRNIHIPASVKLIECWGNLYANSITVDKENKVYDSRENCNAIIETETNTMIMGCESTFIPNGVEIIKENCLRNLRNIHIPASVKLIEDSGILLLANSITVDKENKVYDSRENCNAIIETKTNTMIFGCKNTFIPNGVEIIKDNCLHNLRNIHIPASVKLIEDSGNSLFVYSITVDKENKVYDSRENCNAIIETKTNTMIFGCKNTFIPNGVEIIKDNCLHNLRNIHIPASVKLIEVSDNLFANSITVDKENKVYDSRENCNAIIETETNTMIMGCESTFIPNGVEIIKDNCLRKLRNIHIPASVKLIEGWGNLLFANSITVDKENKVYDSRENCNAIIETETNKVLFECKNTVVPKGVVERKNFILVRLGPVK